MNKDISIVKQMTAISNLIEDKTAALMVTTKLSLDHELHSFMFEVVDNCYADKEIRDRLKQITETVETKDIVEQIVREFLSGLLDPPKGSVAISTDKQIPVELEDKVTIEYVAIRITSRDDKTFYSEYSMHQPSRHENLIGKVKQLAWKSPDQLGDVEEGFKTDEGKFLTRHEVMSIYRAGNLRNTVDFKYGKPDDTEMQSIYLW